MPSSPYCVFSTGVVDAVLGMLAREIGSRVSSSGGPRVQSSEGEQRGVFERAHGAVQPQEEVG
jgi:hypothetical protein